MAPGREIDQVDTLSRVIAPQATRSPGGRIRDRAIRGGEGRVRCAARARDSAVAPPIGSGRARLRAAGLSPPAAAQGPNHSASKFYPDSSDTAEALLRNAAEPRPGRAVVRGDRDLSAGHRAVRRQGRQAPQGEGRRRRDGDEFVLFVDLRGHLPPVAGRSCPPEARAIYRNRVDSQAERWFRQGERQRDRALLRRVVDQAFCSSWGDDALELLGDLAFQDGRFGEALAMYRQLVPDRPEDTFSLVHPDPSVDLARVAAKKLLCRAAAGEAVARAGRARGLREAVPRSRRRAGRPQGAVRDDPRRGARGPTISPRRPSPTAAGRRSPGRLTRTKVVAEPIDVGSLQWRVELDRISPHADRLCLRPAADGDECLAVPQDRLLAYHPIVLGDQVIVCDGSRVLAYNLNDRPERPRGIGAAGDRAGLEARPREHGARRRTGATRGSRATR